MRLFFLKLFILYNILVLDGRFLIIFLINKRRIFMCWLRCFYRGFFRCFLRCFFRFYFRCFLMRFFLKSLNIVLIIVLFLNRFLSTRFFCEWINEFRFLFISIFIFNIFRDKFFFHVENPHFSILTWKCLGNLHKSVRTLRI